MDQDHIQKFITYESKLGDRDKTFKAVQYGAKVLLWYFLTDPKADISVQVSKLGAAITLHRKLFRYFNFLTELKKANATLNKIQNGKGTVNDTITLVKDLAMAIYWLGDNIVYLSKVGAVNNVDTQRYSKLSLQAWTIANLCSLYLDLQTLSKAKPEAKQLMTIQCVKAVCDVLTPAGLLQYVPLHDGQVGIVGLTSAIIHHYLAWPATS